MNIEGFDLNLLVALEALLQERHVTRAAARVGLSQPAMSNALSRLRTLLADPLLVRTSQGMALTPRAEELREPIAEALAQVHRVISRPGPFEPATSQRTFTLITTDAVGMVLLPPLLERIRRLAPGLCVEVEPLREKVPWDLLEAGQVDFAIGVYPKVPGGMHQRALYEERFVCLVRQGHPQVHRRLTLEQYIQLPHVLVTTSRIGLGQSIVDQRLAELGLKRWVALRIPHFLVAPMVVSQTDYIITFPERVVRALAELLPLQVIEPPIELPGYGVSLIWHERLQQDPAVRWFRDQIVEQGRRL